MILFILPKEIVSSPVVDQEEGKDYCVDTEREDVGQSREMKIQATSEVNL